MRRGLCLVLLLAAAQPTWAWGTGHGLIRAWAADHLSAGDTAQLAPLRARLCRECLAQQDTYANNPTPELARYCQPPGLRLSLHDVNDPAVSAQGFLWYLTQITTTLRAGQPDDAARYLGVLCHWLEDPGSPSAHCLSPMGLGEAQLRDLLPPTPDKEPYAYTYGLHGVNLDSLLKPLAEAAYTPRLLGATPEQAAFHLVHRQRQLAQRARSMVIPSLQAWLADDLGRATSLVSEQARFTAELVADALHTALCLAGGVEAGEAAARDGFPVNRLDILPLGGKADEPYVWVPFLRNRSLDGQRKLQPLRLPGRAEPYAEGFGAGGHGLIQVLMPMAGVYRKLTATVGLLDGAGAKGAVRFVVMADSKVLARSEAVRSAQAPLKLEVALPVDKPYTLRLTIEPEPGSRDVDNLAVWAEPRLWR